MSLTKLLKAPIKLFKKEVITFLIVRRYDLGCQEDKLRYIAIRPSASVSVLRQKVWHLLDLPDFCEELIVLKLDADTEVPLIELRKGNDPQHPYILEVWLPKKLIQSNTTVYNLLTIGNGDVGAPPGTGATTNTIHEENQQYIENSGCNCHSQSTISNDTMALNRLRIPDNKRPANNILMDFKKSDISCRISSCSLFKLHSRKSRDNFTNILLKIQSDLSTLSNKLTTLENKIPNC